jgi:type III restriction enzyme
LQCGVIDTDRDAVNENDSHLFSVKMSQEEAGTGYRYFLVFQDKDISMTGAYPMSEFLKILAEL